MIHEELSSLSRLTKSLHTAMLSLSGPEQILLNEILMALMRAQILLETVSAAVDAKRREKEATNETLPKHVREGADPDRQSDGSEN